MKKALLLLVVMSVFLVACGGGAANSKPLQEMIVGKWSGMMVNTNGDRVPVEWEFITGGTMVAKFPVLNMSYGGKWSVDGSRVNFTTELDPDKPNYRDVEFVSDDVMKMTKAEAKIEETFSRIKE